MLSMPHWVHFGRFSEMSQRNVTENASKRDVQLCDLQWHNIHTTFRENRATSSDFENRDTWKHGRLSFICGVLNDASISLYIA
jgi:hypothetical protein